MLCMNYISIRNQTTEPTPRHVDPGLVARFNWAQTLTAPPNQQL